MMGESGMCSWVWTSCVFNEANILQFVQLLLASLFLTQWPVDSYRHCFTTKNLAGPVTSLEFITNTGRPNWMLLRAETDRQRGITKINSITLSRPKSPQASKWDKQPLSAPGNAPLGEKGGIRCWRLSLFKRSKIQISKNVHSHSTLYTG